MLKNYFKITVRNLIKNKTYVSINVLGLAIALACCIIAFLNTKFDAEFDAHHENLEKIYMVQSKKEVQGQFIPYGITPRPLGQAIANDLAGGKVVRFHVSGLPIKDKSTNKILSKRIGFADNSFFDVFSAPILKGSEESFKEKGNILISEKTAITYFGGEDPLGEILTVFNNDGNASNYIVSAVFADPPENSTLQFELLLSFDNYYDILEVERNDWKQFIGGTFVYLENPTEVQNFEARLTKYIPIQNKARDDWKVASFYLAPMTIISDTGREMRSYWFFESLHPAAVATPPVMAILILLIACFNFTNTSIATSSRRLKEIGIRKVIGGSRKQLVIQFMGENIFICFVAIILSLVIATYLVPAYGALWEGVTLELSLLKNFSMYLFLFGLLIFTAILAGAYPALYVSKFEPVSILRGTIKIGGTSMLSKILLTAQYAITGLALFASIGFTQNAVYQNNLDLGFNRDEIIGVEVDNMTEYKKMKAAFDRHPDIIATAGTGQHVGHWEYSRTLTYEDIEVETSVMDFGPDYIETMGLELIEGREFSKDLMISDKDNSILVNETLVKEFDWENPIGKKIRINDTTKLTVIGVMKDVYTNGFWAPIGPLAVRAADEEKYNYVVGRVSGDKLVSSYKAMEDSWSTEIPNRPFDGFYQEDVLKEAKTVNNNIVVIFSCLGVMAVILSCIGLFTLVSLNVIRRIKEIGVRKVLGGSTEHIIGLLNKDFLAVLLLGSVLGVVAGYFLVDLMISSIFTYYQAVSTTTFVIPIAIVLITSFGISSLRISNTARKNPIESLRYE